MLCFVLLAYMLHEQSALTCACALLRWGDCSSITFCFSFLNITPCDNCHVRKGFYCPITSVRNLMYVWKRAVRRCSWRGGKVNSYGCTRGSERTIISYWSRIFQCHWTQTVNKIYFDIWNAAKIQVQVYLCVTAGYFQE